MIVMISFRGEKRLEVEDEIRKQVDAIMREELDLLKMVIIILIFTTIHLVMLVIFSSISSQSWPSHNDPFKRGLSKKRTGFVGFYPLPTRKYQKTNEFKCKGIVSPKTLIITLLISLTSQILVILILILTWLSISSRWAMEEFDTSLGNEHFTNSAPANPWQACLSLL